MNTPTPEQIDSALAWVKTGQLTPERLAIMASWAQVHDSPSPAVAAAGILAAALTTSREDSRRLDWLGRFLQLGGSSIFCACTGEANKLRVDDTDETQWNHALSIGYSVEKERGIYSWRELSNGAKGIRPAIDAAIAAEEAGP